MTPQGASTCEGRKHVPQDAVACGACHSCGTVVMLAYFRCGGGRSGTLARLLTQAPQGRHSLHCGSVCPRLSGACCNDPARCTRRTTCSLSEGVGGILKNTGSLDERVATGPLAQPTSAPHLLHWCRAAVGERVPGPPVQAPAPGGSPHPPSPHPPQQQHPSCQHRVSRQTGLARSIIDRPG